MGAPFLPACDLIGELLSVADSKKTLDDLADEYDNILNKARGHSSSNLIDKKNDYKRTPRITEKVKETTGKDKELGWYFLQGEELKDAKLAPKNSWCAFQKNPHISSKREIASLPWNIYNDGMTGMGDAHYIIPGKKKDDSFILEIFQFNENVPLEKVILASKGSGHIFTNFVSKSFWIRAHNEHTETDQQEIYFLKCMLNYQKRINAEIIFKGKHIKKELFQTRIKENIEYFKKIGN